MTVAGRALPQGRYGGRGRPAARRTRWIAAACAVLVGCLIGYVAYANLGGAAIETERTGFTALPGNALRMNFTVLRDQPERAVVCIVRVRARDGAETGRKEVLVPAGGTTTSVTTVIQSTDEPVTADVFGCSYEVPAYLLSTRPSG
ncbi:MAG TPA: DUF4307 domain-containing protein [Actinophytocola sp.]|uniref:DUF4307 domain-containing protein n=1 Tax=Actinophytocola sp. TaxID=1872138 RepID=UPI002DB5FAC7|nr:DUF4307 domain-containing protein [Actinophytocola sp.]HEU5472026.1 DUF4307 domain-containing protein [Actinophytocola sp.]